MASENHDLSAQVPQLCHMCEETTHVKFQCIDCNFLLCEKCRKLHEKVKTQNIHKIVGLKAGKRHKMKNVDVQISRCKNHGDQNYIMSCVDCEQLVCATCVFTTHNKHSMGDMNNLLSNKIHSLEQYQEEIDKTILPRITRKCDILAYMMEFHTKKGEKAKRDIDTWSKYLKTAFNNYIDYDNNTYVEEIDKSMEEINDKIGPQIGELTRIKKEVQAIRDQICESIQRNEVNTLVDLELVAKSVLNQTKVPALQLRNNFLEFERGEIFKSIHVLGKLICKTFIELRHNASFKTGLPCIDKIMSDKDDTLFVRNWETRTVVKMKLEGKRTIKTAKWKVDVKDMAALSTGELLLIFADKTEVRIFSIENQRHYQSEEKGVIDTEIFYKTTPQIPTALHVTREKRVIVSSVEPGRDWLPMDDPCKVQILVLTERGELISSFDYDKDLFCFPNKLTSLSEGLICIADSISDYSGRLVTIDSSGKVKWIYGNGDMSIIVADMISTPTSTVIIFEACQCVLHAIDPDGVKKRTWSLRELNISAPYSISLYMDELLCVGCGHDGENLHLFQIME